MENPDQKGDVLIRETGQQNILLYFIIANFLSQVY